MIGFILAAGFGTRLKPLTDHIPKALVPVCGISLLERNLRFLKQQGINNLSVNVHYLPEKIYSFRELSSISFEIFNEEEKIRGTGGALYFARDYLETDEMFCITNADIISNANIKKLTEQFIASESICALVATPAINKGTILYTGQSRKYNGIPSNPIENCESVPVDFIGMAFYKKEILNIITKDDFSILPIWKRALDGGQNVSVLVEDELYWRDTGTPSQLAQIHFDVLDKKTSLEIPKQMKLDFERKIAYPNTFSLDDCSSLKEYVWYGSNKISPDVLLSNSIVFDGVNLKENGNVSNLIYTPWGGIPFES